MHRSLARIFFSSLGLMFVALVCASSGFLYGIDRAASLSSDRVNIAVLVFYAALTFPYFYSRFAALEGPVPDPQELANMARTVPFFIALPCLMVVLEALLLLIAPGKRLVIAEALAEALLAFAYLGGRMYWLVSRGPEGHQTERLFKNKVLLPALATCMVSFSFGWTLVSPELPFWRILAALALIVAGREFLSDRGWPWAVGLISIVVVIAATALIVTGSTVASVILVGIVLTLAMGVAEVCKRVVWLRQGHRELGQVTPPENERFYLAGANWSSAVFPLLLFLLPLLVPGLPVLPIGLIVAAQFILWHVLSGEKRANWLAVANIGLGFCMPLVFVWQHFVRSAHVPAVIERVPLSTLLEIAAITMGGYFFAVERVFDVRKFARRGWSWDAYLEEDNCFLLFILVSLVLFCLVATMAALSEAGVQYVQPKAKETLAAILILWFAVAIFKIGKGGILHWFRAKEREAKQRANPGRHMLKQLVVAVLLLGRLPIALIAGLPILVLLMRHTGLSLLAAAGMCVPMIAATMAGFIFNDIFDIAADKNSSRYKALVKGDVSVRFAAWLAAALCATAVFVAMNFARNYSAIVIAVTLFGVIIYSPLARILPAGKGLVTAALSCFPILYASQLDSSPVPHFYYAVLFIFVFGREVLLDVQDFEKDRLAGMRTIVAYFGERQARMTGWSLMVCSLVAMMFAADGFPKVVVASSLAALLACLLLYKESEYRGLVWTRVPLVMAVLGASLTI